MDGSSHQIEVDSASTANEICLQLGATIGIQDIFGFSIFIKLFEKVNIRSSRSTNMVFLI